MIQSVLANGVPRSSEIPRGAPTSWSTTTRRRAGALKPAATTGRGTGACYRSAAGNLQLAASRQERRRLVVPKSNRKHRPEEGEGMSVGGAACSPTLVATSVRLATVAAKRSWQSVFARHAPGARPAASVAPGDPRPPAEPAVRGEGRALERPSSAREHDQPPASWARPHAAWPQRVRRAQAERAQRHAGRAVAPEPMAATVRHCPAGQCHSPDRCGSRPWGSSRLWRRCSSARIPRGAVGAHRDSPRPA